MCNPASFVLTKDEVFWAPDSDSHTDILAFFKIPEEDNSNIVHTLRVEITPPGEDYSRPASEWTFRIDQDCLPIWYDLHDDEVRARKALDAWIAAKVMTKGFKETEKGITYATGPLSSVTVGQKAAAYIRHGANATAYSKGVIIAHDDCRLELYDQSEASLYDSSHADICGNSRVYLYNQSSVAASGFSVVKASNQSRVTAYNRSTVDAYNNTMVTACNHAQVSAYQNARVVASDRAVVSAFQSATVEAKGNAVVYATDSVVLHLSQFATGIITDGNVTFTLADHASIVDQRGDVPVLHTAKTK